MESILIKEKEKEIRIGIPRVLEWRRKVKERDVDRKKLEKLLEGAHMFYERIGMCTPRIRKILEIAEPYYDDLSNNAKRIIKKLINACRIAI